ncbi:MAG TPA: glucosaminidase domain-containing protein [Bacteroidales bacterium]|nr:glucosaminidase domain-containing protein [Bacteroidales bacterium]HPS18160.1 glucosaminidase domain-containing protein [Bacteroidales bacterium]
MKKLSLTIFFTFIAISFTVIAFTSAPNTKKYTLTQYVDTFKIIAVEEMNHSGVPASITLAQAILESGYGNSYLAQYANNHFGIKNKPDWKGEKFWVGSNCYKKYKNILESYADHSNHIKTRKWYANLFSLNITDYKNWAFGLKKAGYAEDPSYAYRLIYIIEKYKFNSLDSLYCPEDSTSLN